MTDPTSATKSVLGTTASSFPSSHQLADTQAATPYFVDNEFRFSATKDFIDVHDPATNKIVSKVPKMIESELKEAVASAEAAFPGWKGMSTIARQQIMFRFVALIREHWDRLAAIITLEQGKTVADSKGDGIWCSCCFDCHLEP